jgi:hypothetical protein
MSPNERRGADLTPQSARWLGAGNLATGFIAFGNVVTGFIASKHPPAKPRDPPTDW